MREDILKKIAQQKCEDEKYYFYNKEQVEVLSKEELEARKRTFLKENSFHLLQEAKKPSHSKPTSSNLEGNLGAREEAFVILQTAQSIERYEFPDLVGVMPIALELSYLSANSHKGAFGKSRWHGYEKSFSTIDEKNYALHLPDGRLFLFEELPDGTFKDKGALGVKVEDCSHGFKEPCFKLYYPTGKIEQYKNEKLVSIKDQHGNSITLTYEGDRLKKVENSSGSFYRFYYENGLLVKQQDHSGRAWYFEYDEEEYLTKISLEHLLERSYAYENAHHYLSSIKNALGEEQLSLRYNKAGELEGYTQAEEVVEYVWHTKSQIEKITQLDERTVYGLDDYGLISHISYPDGTVESAIWDEKRHEEREKTRGGNEVVRTFDEQGRVLSVVRNEIEEQRYSYQADNPHPQSLTTPDETTTYEYDEKHNLLAIHHEDGTATKYRYNPQGEVVEIVDAKGNLSSYVYNEQGEISQATDALGNSEYYEYDTLGRVTQK